MDNIYIIIFLILLCFVLVVLFIKKKNPDEIKIKFGKFQVSAKRKPIMNLDETARGSKINRPIIVESDSRQSLNIKASETEINDPVIVPRSIPIDDRYGIKFVNEGEESAILDIPGAKIHGVHFEGNFDIKGQTDFNDILITDKKNKNI